ncbi:MAG: hypothetical protein JST19_06715 [Bacteroidetes bacterium]|nr:hypothetical protein [Bacteroidota bacterium]
MKKLIISVIVTSTLTTGCKPGAVKQTAPKNKSVATTVYSQFIPVDSANKMIGSYLNSINYTSNDTDLHALTLDAAQLRRYLDSGANSSQITGVKIVFAHTLEYINAGHANQYAGYGSGDLTLVIVGYDATGNYEKYNNNTVLEYAAPCPNTCPIGQAANNFISN